MPRPGKFGMASALLALPDLLCAIAAGEAPTAALLARAGAACRLAVMATCFIGLRRDENADGFVIATPLIIIAATWRYSMPGILAAALHRQHAA